MDYNVTILLFTLQIALQMKTEILSNVERYLTIDFREVLEKLGATEDATNKVW